MKNGKKKTKKSEKKVEPACGCATCCVVCTECEVCAVNCLVSECLVCFCAWGAAVRHCGRRRTPPNPQGDIRSGLSTHTVSNPRQALHEEVPRLSSTLREFLDDPRSGQSVKLTPGLLLSLRPFGPRGPSLDSTSVRKESKMRSSFSKASNRSVTFPLVYDLRRLHPFEMWVKSIPDL